jgi:hypothetical protein
VPVRRATADVASATAAGRMQRSSPVQGRTAGSQAAGPSGGYVKGAAAAAGNSSVAGPRRATVDVAGKGSLHMMSRNSYLQVRAEHVAGHCAVFRVNQFCSHHAASH